MADEVLKELLSFVRYMEPDSIEEPKSYWVHFPLEGCSSPQMNYGWMYFEFDKGTPLSKFKRNLKKVYDSMFFFHSGVSDFNTDPDFFKSLLKKNYTLICSGSKKPNDLI